MARPGRPYVLVPVRDFGHSVSLPSFEGGANAALSPTLFANTRLSTCVGDVHQDAGWRDRRSLASDGEECVRAVEPRAEGEAGGVKEWVSNSWKPQLLFVCACGNDNGSFGRESGRHLGEAERC